MALSLCAACARHVRSTDPLCPFCGHGPVGPAIAPRTVPEGATRAQIFLGALSLVAVAGASGCSKTEPPQDSTKGIVMPYGAPPNPTPDAGSRADAAAPMQPPSPVGAYGAPPPRASSGDPLK